MTIFFWLVPRLPASDLELSMLPITQLVVFTPECTFELLGRSTKFLKNRWLSSDLSLILLNYLESDPLVYDSSLGQTWLKACLLRVAGWLVRICYWLLNSSCMVSICYFATLTGVCLIELPPGPDCFKTLCDGPYVADDLF